ncbi:hypothetical protein [Hymenobacter wooponensis]|uniref:Uncharacterized protein n=1 Tax=Hymenobacter wooponensis TaxID=1525360 RepID=A0A4Z0MD14_9BACT|nr:hypothetical protein [Hymenobacter wooponensis]TGD77613.1 hypothetical protein EU557_22830 [Hymenobacter wooponensis]
MKPHKQALVQELSQQLAPQLSRVTLPGGKPPKGVLKALYLLAEQLDRAQAKQEKRAANALKPKQIKQKLSDELTLVLTTHFSDQELAAKESQLLAETADELAEKLTNVRTKQARKRKASAREQNPAEVDSAAPRPRRRSSPPEPVLPRLDGPPAERGTQQQQRKAPAELAAVRAASSAPVLRRPFCRCRPNAEASVRTLPAGGEGIAQRCRARSRLRIPWSRPSASRAGAAA